MRRPSTGRATEGGHMQGIARREFLKRSAVAVGAAAAAPLLGAARARAAAASALDVFPFGRLGLVGVDHVGITVPDIGEAIDWFEDILGAVAPLTFGPFEGDFLQGALGVPAGTKIDQITMLRVGH